jgi:hypothetical protein
MNENEKIIDKKGIYRSYRYGKILLPATCPDFLTLALETDADYSSEHW